MYAISPNISKITNISEELIVSVNEFGAWKNLSPSAITAQEDLIEDLILTATEAIENYTWISLRYKTFESYYDLTSLDFYSFVRARLKLGLQRSPILKLENITKIEYLDNDVWVEFNKGSMTIDGLYNNVTEKHEQRQWASIYFKEEIPFQDRCNAYKIRVTYNAGYDPIETDPALMVPAIMKTAIKKIAAFHYTDRGDCVGECSLDGFPVPCSTKGMLDQISVRHSTLGYYYTPASGECYDC
jgi:hypothetical protein